jgi:RNA polymerase sigma-70 factor (ECF subfamily)
MAASTGPQGDRGHVEAGSRVFHVTPVPSGTTNMNDQDWLADRFEANRAHLRGVAYRMLGSLPEADDAVQETWIRLSRTDTSDVENLRAWLTTVVGRVCLNVLRSRTTRRESSLETHVPDPVVSPEEGTDPEQEALLGDSVGLAMLVVLDALAPAERVAFVLHDVFAIPFDDIAPVLDRSTAATRQLASRARARVRSQEATLQAERRRQAELVDAFLAAARHGDFEALLALLDPDVVLRADERAVAMGAPRETRGAQPVGAFARRARGATPALLDGAPAAVWIQRGELRVVYRFTTSSRGITAIELVADPDRIEQLDLVVSP